MRKFVLAKGFWFLCLLLLAIVGAKSAHAVILVAAADTEISEPTPDLPGNWVLETRGSNLNLNARHNLNQTSPRHETILTRFDLSAYSPADTVLHATFNLTTQRNHTIAFDVNLLGLFEADAGGNWDEATTNYATVPFYYQDTVPTVGGDTIWLERNDFLYDRWDLVPNGNTDLSETKIVELVGNAASGFTVPANFGENATLSLTSHNLVSFLQTAINNGDNSVSLLLVTRTNNGTQFKFHSREADVVDAWKPHLNLRVGVPGDVDGDGFVDLVDFETIRANLFLSGSQVVYEDGDLDFDLDVDFDDFGIWKTQYLLEGGSASDIPSLSGVAVPEPTSMGLLAMFLVTLLASAVRRSRIRCSYCVAVVAALIVGLSAQWANAVILVAAADTELRELRSEVGYQPENLGDIVTLNARHQLNQTTPRHEAILTRFDLSAYSPTDTIREATFNLTHSRTIANPASFSVNLLGLFEVDAGIWDEATTNYSNVPFYYQDTLPTVGGDTVWVERNDFVYDRWDLVPNGNTDLSETKIVELVGNAAAGVVVPTPPINTTVSLTSDDLVSFLQTAINNGDSSVSLLFMSRTNHASQFKFHSREADVIDAWKPHLDLKVGVPGDVNGDGLVDLDDLDIIRGNFYQPVASLEDGDLNENGFVDFLDYRIWRDNANVPPGSAALTDPFATEVPEPSTLVGFLAMGLLALLMRRRAAFAVALEKSRRYAARYLLAGLFWGAAGQVGLAQVINVQFLPTTSANWNVIDAAVWQNAFDPGAPPNAQFDEVAIINSGGTAQVTDLPFDVGGINLTNGAVDILDGGNLTVRIGDTNASNGTITVGANGRLGMATGGSLHTRRLVLQSGGTFSNQIAGASHSPILVDVDATLSGNLTVHFTSTPSLGTSYALLDAATIVNNLSSVSFAFSGSLGAGHAAALRQVAGGTNGQVLQVELEQRLVLNVDRTSGVFSIVNPTGSLENFQLDAYSVSSGLGALNPSGWNSLDAQNVDGSSWHVAGTGATANLLAELSTGWADLAPSQSRTLGALYAPQFITFGQETEDYTFTYHTVTGGTKQGVVTYTGDKQYNNIVITVDETGHAIMQNESPFSVSFEGYTISSASGALRTSWTSLQDQGAVNGGWLEAGPTANRLSEVMFQNGVVTTLQQGTGFDLGQLMNVGGSFEQDLVFEFLMPGATTLFRGVVVYGDLPELNPTLPGDHNGDGVVNAADYVLWRDTLVGGNPAGYNAWKANFGSGNGGSGSSAGSAASVPEPHTLTLFLMSACAMAVVRRKTAS